MQQIFIQTTKSTSTQNKHHNTHRHILRNVCIPFTAIGPAWSKSVHATYLETGYRMMYGSLSLSLSLLPSDSVLYLLMLLLPSDTTFIIWCYSYLTMLHLPSDALIFCCYSYLQMLCSSYGALRVCCYSHLLTLLLHSDVPRSPLMLLLPYDSLLMLLLSFDFVVIF